MSRIPNAAPAIRTCAVHDAGAPADRTLTLADGRRLTYRCIGRTGGRPVIALHGTPGSRGKFDAAAGLAEAHGLELISVDRWGYGGSDAPPRPNLGAYGADMLALADALEIPRFAVLGVSGGGPFAAAVAAAGGSRVSALALVAPVGPIDGVGLAPFHGFVFRVLPRVPGAVRSVFWVYRGLMTAAPRASLHLMTARAGRSDRETILHSPAGEQLLASFRLGFTAGVGGPVLDTALFCRPWGLELSRIQCPAALWLGDADRNVPRTAALALATAIPRCMLIERPGDGHFWPGRDLTAVLEWFQGSA